MLKYIIRSHKITRSHKSERGITMFIYNDNKQVKSEFKKMVIDCNMTMTDIARECNLIPQQLNNRFNNSRLALSDLKKWCNAMGCDLVIDIVKRP